MADASKVEPARLEFRALGPDLAAGLADLFAALGESGDVALFHPHPLTAAEAQRLAQHRGLDLYYVAWDGQRVLAYGLLRGWDEGYAIPSLGIAIHPAARGTGLARPFMAFLHAAARLRGAGRVRLTVYKTNAAAVELYRRLGYQLEEKNADEWVGYLDL